MAAATHPLDTLTRYQPFDFRAEKMSLQTAFPYFRDSRKQAELIISVVHPFFTSLSARLTAEYSQVSDLPPNEMAKKSDEYKRLTSEFQTYTTWLENAESYLRDLKYAIAYFDRPSIDPTTLNTLFRFNPEVERIVQDLQTTARTQVGVMKKISEQVEGQITLARTAHKQANEALGWFGKAVAGNGTIPLKEWLKQWAKPREHSAGSSRI